MSNSVTRAECSSLDLKPSNVVVDDADPKQPSAFVIIDFGFSMFVEVEKTTIEGFCGTPPWVAPEIGTCSGLEISEG
jgi:serine/threonine protein kinase